MKKKKKKSKRKNKKTCQRASIERKQVYLNKRRSLRMPRTHKVLVATAQRGCAHNTHLQQHFQRSPSTNVPTPPGITHHTVRTCYLAGLDDPTRCPVEGPSTTMHTVFTPCRHQTSLLQCACKNSRHLASFPQPIRVGKKPHSCLATVLFERKDR